MNITKAQLVVIILALFFPLLATAQPKMTVSRYGMTMSYICFSKDINSLSQIPKPMIDSANTILIRYIGDVSKYLKFSGGQIIDTAKYLKSEKAKAVPSNIPK